MLQSEDDLNLLPPHLRAPKNTWCVLMVDDDTAVHCHPLALRGYEYKGRSFGIHQRVFRHGKASRFR